MLSIKHSHHFHLLSPRTRPRMQLGAIAADNDELIEAIEAESRSGRIDLEETDITQLEQFWNGVEKDIQNDPEWFTFAED